MRRRSENAFRPLLGIHGGELWDGPEGLGGWTLVRNRVPIDFGDHPLCVTSSSAPTDLEVALGYYLHSDFLFRTAAILVVVAVGFILLTRL